MQEIYEIANTAQGCGEARFASLGALREHRNELLGQQAAIIARRAALARGDDADEAEALLFDDLANLGMDRETIQEHLADPWKDVDGLFIGTDLIERD